MDIFHNPTKTAPKKDDMIVRVDLEKPQLASQMPTPRKTGNLGVSHVPNKT